MRLMSSGRHCVGGFSLLEMMVAISILALSLGAIYQSTSGATRNVRVDEKYAYSVELARSLLADNAMVPASGLRSRGETEGGFSWQIVAQPIGGQRKMDAGGVLMDIEVVVSWVDGMKQHQVALYSVVEGFGE